MFAERFELGEEVGAGGMGTVWRAHDSVSGEVVALKILRGSEHLDLARFAREAKLLDTLEHPNIVRYVAHDARGDSAWIAMEWLDGETLDHRVVREVLSATEAVPLIRQAATALAHAHAKGIVHRDVKPANLFLCADGTLKVLDFGIARSVLGGHTLTMTGTTIGTPHYMSPEQARAERGVDPSTDVYALGCVLYEALTGVRPFDGETAMAVLAKILLEEPRPLAEILGDVPADLERLVHRMLRKDRSRRIGNASQLIEAIDGLGELGPTSPRSIIPKIGKSEQRLVCLVMVADVGFHGGTAPTMVQVDDASEDLIGRMQVVANEFGGKADVLADGSAVVTVSGADVATDQATRAARLALALRELWPSAPMAVVAGRSVLTARLPAGGVVDRGVAALTATREPRIWIDEVVHGLLDEHFVRRGEEGARFLEPGHRQRVDRSLMGKRTPCVGRRRELAMLHAITDEAFEEPVARAVVIRAPAGGGKSRLVHEWLSEMEHEVSLFFGRADSTRSRSPYAALASAIRMAAGIVDGEPLAMQQRKLSQRISEVLVVDADARRRVTCFIAELLRIPFADDVHPALEAARKDPQLMGDAVRTATEDWLAVECARRPVMIVVEDVQHADRPSVELLDGLLRHLEEAPLVVVATARDDVDDVYPSLWVDRDAQEVRLARLTKRASAKLVRHVLSEAGDEVVQSIVERADGNAFFLEELVRAHVRQESGDALPDTVLGMVEARIARMEPGARRALRAASVFGNHFWTAGVQHLLGNPRPGEPNAEQWIQTFAADELIGRSTRSALAGQDEHHFRQTLVRDAAYAMLTDEDRELGHRLCAAWLRDAGERDPRVLADHLRLGGEPERASESYCEAAAQALDANDYEAALTNVALGSEGELPPRRIGELASLEAEAHRWTGNYDEAAGAAARAIAHLPPGEARWFQAVGGSIVSLGMLGKHDEAKRLGIVAANTEGDEAERLVCLCRAAHRALGVGDLAHVDSLLETIDQLASAVLRNRIDARTEAWLHTTHAARALHVGEISSYLEGTAAAVRAYDLAGDRRHACNQRVRLGYGFIGVGELQLATEELRSAVDDAQRLGISVVEGYALQNLGWALALSGEVDEAQRLERRALQLGQRIDNAAVEGGARFYLSRIALHDGDHAEAIAQAEVAAEVLAVSPPLRTLCVAALARAHAAAGNAMRAEMLAHEAIEGLETLATMPEEQLFVWLAWLQADGSDASLKARARAALDKRLGGMSAEHRASFESGPEGRALIAALR